MLNPKEVNYSVTQGDSFILNITYTDSNNNPIDLTGYSVYVEIKDKPGGKIICATASIGDGVSIPNPTTGVININLTPAKTQKFILPRSAYRIQITSSNGTATTIGNGWIVVDAG